jgi:hypothetical protein
VIIIISLFFLFITALSINKSRTNLTRVFKKIFFIFSLFSFSVQLKANQNQVQDFIIKQEDYIYKSSIKTAQLRETSYELAAPIIELGTEQQLKLSFDDLNGEFENYNYTFIHCDAYWNPSDLMQNEYLSVFFEDNISNYTYSVNTLQKYTHYQVNFPNANMKITKSGNYILFVYENGDKNKPVLTKRFMVYQSFITISGTVQQAAKADDYMSKQEVDFSIIHPNYKIINPFQDLKVVITQNNRWDNAINNLKPLFVNPNELNYNYDDGSNCFDSGNEFRNFDNKSFKFLTPFVSHHFKDSSNQNNTFVLPELVKTFKRYVQVDDVNGEFFIRNTEMDRNENEADYAWVHFFLPYKEPLGEGNFYVAGKFCDWNNSDQNKLKYNYSKKGYELKMYLKQGYYNYFLVYQKDEKTPMDETLLEGNHWETENDYSIFVYHRSMGTYYDQLIGIKKLNSIRRQR